MRYLTVKPQGFVKYFQAKQSYQEYITLLMFRVIANLHCFNSQVSPPEHEGLFVTTIIEHLSTMYVQNEDGELEQKKPLTPPFVMANFFYLFQWVTYRFAFTVSEHNYWQEFLALLESKMEIKYPIIKVPGMKPPKSKDPAKPAAGLCLSYHFVTRF